MAGSCSDAYQHTVLVGIRAPGGKPPRPYIKGKVEMVSVALHAIERDPSIWTGRLGLRLATIHDLAWCAKNAPADTVICARFFMPGNAAQTCRSGIFVAYGSVAGARSTAYRVPTVQMFPAGVKGGSGTCQIGQSNPSAQPALLSSSRSPNEAYIGIIVTSAQPPSEVIGALKANLPEGYAATSWMMGPPSELAAMVACGSTDIPDATRGVDIGCSSRNCLYNN